jgi:hypothetical protein
MVIMDPGSWARAESAGGAMPPLWQYFSLRQNDDIGNLEPPEARLDQPVALHAAATAAAREGLAVRIDGSPRALLQFDRDLARLARTLRGAARGPGIRIVRAHVDRQRTHDPRGFKRQGGGHGANETPPAARCRLARSRDDGGEHELAGSEG